MGKRTGGGLDRLEPRHRHRGRHTPDKAAPVQEVEETFSGGQRCSGACWPEPSPCARGLVWFPLKDIVLPWATKMSGWESGGAFRPAMGDKPCHWQGVGERQEGEDEGKRGRGWTSRGKSRPRAGSSHSRCHLQTPSEC